MRTVFSSCVVATVLVACSAGGGAPSSTPTITSLAPLEGPVGTGVTIVGTGFSDAANTINFGASAYPNIVSTNGTAIVFIIPTATNPPCRNATPPCAILTALITPGVYDVSVTNTEGTSNSISFTVTKS